MSFYLNTFHTIPPEKQLVLSDGIRRLLYRKRCHGNFDELFAVRDVVLIIKVFKVKVS
jgi:hypothetical protein